MLSLKTFRSAVICVMIFSCLASYARSAPPVVDFSWLIETPGKYDGKFIRVRGYLVKPAHPHDVWMILLYSSKEEATDNPDKRRVLISLTNSRTTALWRIKSGWVEITARVIPLPVGGTKYTPALTDLRSVEVLGEDVRAFLI